MSSKTMGQNIRTGLERISSAPRLSITTQNVFNIRNHNLSPLSRSSPGIYSDEKCRKDANQSCLLHPLSSYHSPPKSILKLTEDSISEIIPEEEKEVNKTFYKLRLELEFTAFVILCFILVIVIPLSMIVMGSIYLSSCVVQPMIPIFLIVGGSTFLFSMGLLRKMNRLANDEDISKACYQKTFSFAILFHFGWFATGCYWIYSIYQPDYVDENSSSYCDKTLYLYSFWFLNIIFLTLSFVTILFTVYILFGREYLGDNYETGPQENC
ncbi:transmembrane protein 272-like isoform X2 [Uloborus diversus]|uniref:transmembrane protein 272-like isoform X2 n=1 Tax=Uloborus diversus TaxID=327109 RepID=UPI0024099C08|nr:transmembrane protein 272-like isoform X2 [Uloborus diversus]